MGNQRTITEQELLENLGWIGGLARRLVGGESDDLVQQVCVAALDRSQIRDVPSQAPALPTLDLKTTGRAPGSTGARESSAAPRVRAWLARATTYLASTHHRATGRRLDRERASARAEALPSAHDVVARNALIARLVQEVDRLDEPYRTTVLLRYLDERSTQAIAAQMGASPALVRKRLSRGLAKLRSELDQRGIDGWALSALVPLRPGAIHSTSSSTTLGAMTMGTTATKIAAGVLIASAATVTLIESEEATTLIGSASLDGDVLAEPAEPAVTNAEVLVDAGVVLASPVAVVQSAGRRAEVAPPPASPVVEVKIVEEQRALVEVVDALRPIAVGSLFIKNTPLPADGFRVETREDGSRKAEGMIVNGHRDGDWTEWHPDGALRGRGVYFAGMRQGAWEFWDADGATTTRGAYLYGLPEGDWETFEDGQREQVQYAHGARHGRLTQRNAADQLVLEEAWFLDKRHGASTSYHPNGTLASQGSYSHGQKAGEWSYWSPDGTLDTERSGLVGPTEEVEFEVQEAEVTNVYRGTLIESAK